jgi:hypothetical protein
MAFDMGNTEPAALAEGSVEEFCAEHAKFPMYVVAVAAVLELSEFLPFQEMLRLGLVRPLNPERDLVTLFVSHQCTSPNGSPRAAAPLMWFVQRLSRDGQQPPRPFW